MTQTLSRAQIEEWRHELLNDYTTNKPAVHELDTLCTMALSHADAYERGQRDMAAAAVKMFEGIAATSDEDAKSEVGVERTSLELHAQIIRHYLPALRALSPGEWLAVPKDVAELPLKTLQGHSYTAGHVTLDVPRTWLERLRALIAAAQE